MSTANLTGLLDAIDALKIKLDALRPLANASLVHALDIEYTCESNRIEGNTLTLSETALIIDKGLTVGGKSMREHLEAANHYEAVLFLREIVQQKLPLTEALVKQLHALILRGIDRDNAGKYRNQPVAISGSRHEPPQPWQVPSAMENCFLWFADHCTALHPVVLAAEMHQRIVAIHPFIDGNGRTVRLVMNLLLLQHGYPLAIIPSAMADRRTYYAALEKSDIEQDTGDFIYFIAQQVFNAMKRLYRIAGGRD